MKWLKNLLHAAFPDNAPELDLHGLQVTEALERVEQTLEQVRAGGLTRLRIICGKGKHSKGGRGVLREAVAGWLDAHGYAGRYRRKMERDGLDGSILVELERDGKNSNANG